MKIRTILSLIVVAIALVAVSLWMGQQAYSWFPPQASAESQLVDNLFSFLVALGTFIFLGVVGTLTYAILFQRAGKYDFSDGPHVEGNVPLEIVWTAIPFVLVMWIAAYSYQIYDQMSILGPMEHLHGGMKAAYAAPMDKSEAIEVLSRQWVWEFRYPKQNLTSTELHLPVNQRVHLVLKSEDVLHGFYIPAFRIKQDIIPNRAIDFEFTPIRTGKYRLRDSQYSGTYFAAMQADVVVESSQDYEQWLKSVATHPPTTADNQAFEEYNQTAQKPISAGWKTVIPAAPPIVNYSGSSS